MNIKRGLALGIQRESEGVDRLNSRVGDENLSNNRESRYAVWANVLMFSLLALLLVASVPKALAQADSGRVSGEVTDQTGAAIPGANLELKSLTTGLVLKATSNGRGELAVAAVPAGDYVASISAAGFSSESQSVRVEVTRSLTLSFSLKPGAENIVVQVTDAASLVNTEDPSLGETIQGEQITELPLNGRNALTLALLTPGVTQGVYGEPSQDTINRNSDSGGGALSANGVRAQANSFILDGVDNNDGLQNVIVFFPPVEATQEFRVITSVAPAQYGRAGGALIVSSIKSGTNQIHGSAFEYYRDSIFNANPNYRFLGAPATPAAKFIRSNFGGSLGSPLIKDKLFLFGDYARLQENNPGSSYYVTVPTALMRQGNFSELLNCTQGNGSCITSEPRCITGFATFNASIPTYSQGKIFDPQTCGGGTAQQFPGNIIPMSRLNPAAVNYLNAFPLPTRTDRVLNNYLASSTSVQRFNTFDVRLDWHPTSKDILFARFSYDNSTANNSSLFANLPAGNGAGSNYNHARGYVLGSTHTFSPHIVNEARVAYTRENYGYKPPFYGQNISQNLGIVNANRNPLLTGGALIGGGGTEIQYTGDYGLFATPTNTYEISDTVNYQLGKHNLQFGGTGVRRNLNFFRPINGKGAFTASTNGAIFTGYEITEFLVGGVTNYQIGAQSGFFGTISQEDGLFIQDDWKVTPRLTLNLGFRWDLLTYPYELHNNQAARDATTGHFLLAGQNGVSRSILSQDYGDFAPRIGFAYNLRGNGTSAIHGGYGIFYFPDYGGINNQLGQNAPFSGNNTYTSRNGYCITFTGQTANPSTATSFTCPGYTTPAAVTNPLPAPGFANFDPNGLNPSITGLAVNRNNKRSRIQEFNVQLQQQFGAKDVFSIAFVGTHSDRLSTYYTQNSDTFNQVNLPLPGQAAFSYLHNNGSANYSGLQTHYEHHAKGLLTTASYVWSHTLDNSPGSFEGATVNVFDNPNVNYGNSLQDVRHNFTASAIYDLPFGHGEKFGAGANRAVDLLIGGFQMNLVSILQSGQPFDLSVGNLAPGNRPDLIAPIKYPKQIIGHWFDPSSFSAASIPTIVAADGVTVFTRIGTLGRNQVYGPSTRVVNFGLQKNMHIREGMQLELHGDGFNIFNTAQFTNPSGSLATASTFGVITGTKANSNRQLQLAARFVF